MKILISTDTSCLVNNEFMNKYEISVFPLNVIINGKEYLDGVHLRPHMVALLNTLIIYLIKDMII